MVTRRQFLKFMIIATNGMMLSMCSRSKTEDNSGKIDISLFDISIPLWLFDKNNKQKDRIKALSIQKNKINDKLIIIFSGNKNLNLNPKTSVNWLIKNNNNQATRKSILLKRITAYSLDAISNKIKKKSKVSLKHNFENFQAEEIINFITVDSLYKLLIDLKNIKRISSIKWDNKLLVFKVK
ncbi:MAG: hypothetical protein GY777_29665 [Candidatus Brocadiaceae bacterium]|nr:hypothetical protein [Candidatus Brocadiaceae bacterium]